MSQLFTARNQFHWIFCQTSIGGFNNTTVGGSGENGGGGGSNRGPVSCEKLTSMLIDKIFVFLFNRISGVPEVRRPREQRLCLCGAVQVRQVRQVLALLRHSGMDNDNGFAIGKVAAAFF